MRDCEPELVFQLELALRFVFLLTRSRAFAQPTPLAVLPHSKSQPPHSRAFPAEHTRRSVDDGLVVLHVHALCGKLDIQHAQLVVHHRVGRSRVLFLEPAVLDELAVIGAYISGSMHLDNEIIHHQEV